MPRITLSDPYGIAYRCDAMSEDTLRAWFDEVLPLVNHDPEYPARISVYPMWRATDAAGVPVDPDWSMDSRVITGLHEFPALTGDEALRALPRVRAALERLAGV